MKTLADRYGPYSQFKTNGKRQCAQCGQTIKNWIVFHHQTDTFYCTVKCMIDRAEKDIYLYGTASNFKCNPVWHRF